MNEREIFSLMIEAINVRVDELNKERKEYEKTIKLSNDMISFQKYMPSLMILIGVVAKGLSGLISGLVGGIPIMLLTYAYFTIVKKIYNKKIQKIDMTIATNLEAKRIVSLELEKRHETKMDVSLEDDFSFVMVYEQEFDDVKKDNDKTNDKVKKRSLRKKK